MEHLNSIFWLGIIVGGLVGFAASVAANLTTPGFGAYFAKGKEALIERNKRRAIKEYLRLRRFQDASEDKYMYFIAQWGYIILYNTLAVAMGILSKASDNTVESLVGGASSVFLLAICASSLFQLTVWYRRINNFKEYEKALFRKWGEIDTTKWEY